MKGKNVKICKQSREGRKEVDKKKYQKIRDKKGTFKKASIVHIIIK